MITLEKLQSADFLPFVNQAFRIRLDGVEPIELELVNVTEAGSGRRPERVDGSALEARRPFALHFLGPVSAQYLVQHIYRFEHDQMGALDLFIVPLGPEAGRMRYEAIFT